MRYLRSILIAIFLCVFVPEHAQEINIGVVVPEETMEGINVTTFNSLQTKLERMLNNCGATSVNRSRIVLFPTFNFISDDVIEGGMRNINSVEIELTLKVVSCDTGNIFGSVTYDLKGKGYDRLQAFKDCLNSLRADDSEFKVFYSDIKDKIKRYYVSNKDDMIKQAQSLAVQKKYEEAIALLYEYPTGVDGYAQVQDVISDIYIQYQANNCSKILQQARARFAVQDYATASALLEDMEGSTPCSEEARALSNQIRKQILSEQAKQRAQKLEEKKIAASVEKSRIRAVSAVMTAYYQSRPRVTYNTIVVRRWWW